MYTLLMKKWFKRSWVEFVLGVGVSIFLINFLTIEDDILYVISIPLLVFGLIRLYQRHFVPVYCTNSFFTSLDDDYEDDLYDDAKEAVIESGKVSTEYLQRKLRVGYSRAARIMDMLESRGIIGPANGSEIREVLITKDIAN